MMAKAGMCRVVAALFFVAAAGNAQPAGLGNDRTKRDYTDGQVLASVARIDLPAPAPSLPAASRNVTGPVRVGVHREVPRAVGALASRLTWTTLADGRIVSAAVVVSSGATFVRVAINASLGIGGELRYFKPGAAPLRHAAVVQADLASARLGGEGAVLWSPSVEGDSIGLEVVLPSAAALADFSLVVVKISHGTVGRDAAWWTQGVSCDHVDVRCRTGGFRAGLEDAVARMLFESGGGTYGCTGTLLAPAAPASGQAFFLTANHCVSTAEVASTVLTTWFLQRATCDSPTIDPGVTVFGGATLLATSVAQDSTLLALRGALPAQVDFAEWKLPQPAHPAAVIGIHHPGADEKKYAGGATRGSRTAVLGSRLVVRNALAVQWDDGLTEGGSSGSGLFHDSALIGVLSGGAGNCSQSGDVYGSFADFYPRACPWLSPGATCVDDGNVPLFLAAGDGRRESFARIVNHSAKPGRVWIYPRDDSGRVFAPVSLSVGANAALHFNSTDLERGNPRKGIARGVGAGVGHWRLRVHAEVDVEVLAYVRTSNGFVTSMHDVVEQGPSGSHVVPFFNPADNSDQVSALRLVNPHEEDVSVVIRGVDDQGVSSAPVRLNLGAGEARSVSASQLERGDATLDGALGDGAGKWRLQVTPNGRSIDVMNLLETPGGKLTNLSTFPAPVSWVAVLRGEPGFRAPFFASAGDAAQQGFVRLSNYGATTATVRLHAVDDAGRHHAPVAIELSPGASRHFNSDDLEDGNPAKGITAGLGLGDGHWRLEFEQVPRDVHTLAYTRSTDGFVTSMHDVVPGPNERHEVLFFNPASNTRQVSKLRLVNPTSEPAFGTIRGVDDQGEEGRGSVHFRVEAGASRTITAQQLERGDVGLSGKLGDGSGNWRLHIKTEAAAEIDVLNLLESPTGDIANLSTGTRLR